MNYTRALEFFIENGISLTEEQLENLKEECIEESGGAHQKYAKMQADKYKKAEEEYNNKDNDLLTMGKALKTKSNLNNEIESRTKDKSTPLSPNLTSEYFSKGGYGKVDDEKLEKFKIKDSLKNYKKSLGVGKENIHKDREPGEYLLKNYKKSLRSNKD